MPPPAVVHCPQMQNAVKPGIVFLILLFKAAGVGTNPS
jgi:hypothetical protein